MLGFLIVFIGVSFLVLVHELGHFFAAHYFKMPVEEFGIGFPPRLFSRVRGGTRYSVNMIPLGGFIKLHGELLDVGAGSFVNQRPWKRAIVLIAGVVMNFIAGWIIFSVVFWIGIAPVIFIDQVAPNSPAALAGMRQGDSILDWRLMSSDAVSAITTSDTALFMQWVNKNKGKEIVMHIQRDGRNKAFTIIPRINPPAGEGALGVVLRGGGFPRQGFFMGLGQGFIAAGVGVWSIIAGLGSIFAEPSAIVGPVGIVTIAVDTERMGFMYIVQLLGIISLNLAVLNIVPIPALDGGRLVFIILEKLRGKPFHAHTEQRATTLGFMFLMVLIISITLKDIAGLL